MPLTRRIFGGAAVSAMAGLWVDTVFAARAPAALARVIIANDFAGDPDGLFQLAHHVLCHALTVPLIIATHLPAGFGNGRTAQDGAVRAREMLAIMHRDNAFAVIAGSEAPIAARNAWQPTAAAQAIVREAMRQDTTIPLIYASGAGLTDLALAWLIEPRIAKAIRLIWIGGNAYAGSGNPGAIPAGPEFNFAIDPLAAQVLFNESDIPIWQVPADAYSRMLFSTAELEELAALGPLGAYLKAQIDALPAMLATIPGAPIPAATDAYVLGDSPLVTLTALVPPLQPDPTSSTYRQIPTPHLNNDGTYTPRPDARPMRVYSEIDGGLTFRDMLARFRLQAHVASVQ